MCEFISQTYSFLFIEPFGNIVLWNLQRDIHKCIEANGEKGHMLRKTVERSFLRNCLVTCEMISQSYMILFMEQFGSTVFGESEKGYFGSH